MAYYTLEHKQILVENYFQSRRNVEGEWTYSKKHKIRLLETSQWFCLQDVNALKFSNIALGMFPFTI